MRSCYPKEGASTMTPCLYFALGLIQSFEAVEATIIVSIMPYIIAEFLRKSDEFISEKELEFRIGQGAGILGGSFFLAAFFSSFFWGWASDRIGRRPVLIFGVAASVIATGLFAISETFMFALACRFVIGLLNGNLGVLKTFLGEVTTSENQATAFAVISVVYAATSVISPLVGGILGGVVPGMPYAFLPGMISAAFGAIIFILCFFFLPETSSFLKRTHPGSIELPQLNADRAIKSKGPSSIFALIRDRAVVLSTINYATVCSIHISIITLLPMFFRAGRRSGGLGMPSAEVGILFAVQGFSLCLFQSFVYPKLAKRYGIITLLKAASQVLSVSILLPLICMYTANILPIGHWLTTVPLMMVIGLPTMTCFTCTNLLVNNSASDGNRGSVYGLGQTLGCLSRCIGPIVTGSLWSFATTIDAPYMPFLILFIMSFSLYALAVQVPSHLRYPKTSTVMSVQSPKHGSCKHDRTKSEIEVTMGQVSPAR